MRVLGLDTASMMTSSGIDTYSPMQQLPNSPEALQTDVSEQRPSSLRPMARKKAIKDVMSGANRTQLLSGWKEIAKYMNQGVRTVQRWEAIGLPVRRVKKTRGAKVIAEELCSTHVHQKELPDPGFSLIEQQKFIAQVNEILGSGRTVLQGWKAIARELDRGVRTVQRWERTLALPVHRIGGKSRGQVIVFSDELRSWLETDAISDIERSIGSSPLADDLDARARSLHVPLIDTIEELRATISSLEAQIRSLKRQLQVRNRPAHLDKTPTSHAITQLSQNFVSGSPPIGEEHERTSEK